MRSSGWEQPSSQRQLAGTAGHWCGTDDVVDPQLPPGSRQQTLTAACKHTTKPNKKNTLTPKWSPPKREKHTFVLYFPHLLPPQEQGWWPRSTGPGWGHQGSPTAHPQDTIRTKILEPEMQCQEWSPAAAMVQGMDVAVPTLLGVLPGEMMPAA